MSKARGWSVARRREPVSAGPADVQRPSMARRRVGRRPPVSAHTTTCTTLPFHRLTETRQETDVQPWELRVERTGSNGVNLLQSSAIQTEYPTNKVHGER